MGRKKKVVVESEELAVESVEPSAKKEIKVKVNVKQHVQADYSSHAKFDKFKKENN